MLDESETARIDLGSYFTDPDGDRLTYEAISRNTPVATARVSGSTVTLRARRLGRAYIRVTARDPDGRTAGQRFLVTVEQGGPAAEVEVTNCEATGSVNPRVTIEGFVRARRRLVGVSVTGWVQSEIDRVTLVLHRQGTPVTSFWARMTVQDLQKAKQYLAVREGTRCRQSDPTPTAGIDHWSRGPDPEKIPGLGHGPLVCRPGKT